MKEVYSLKEQKILDAAIDIIGGGISEINSLKVANIAKHAGIGKGTIYEYFSSKDEIVCEAICYHIRANLEEEWAGVYSESGFKEGVYHAMHSIRQEILKPSVMNIEFLRLIDHELLEKAMTEIKALLRGRAAELYGELLRRGVEEGLFPQPSSPEYAGQALLNVFCGLNFMFRMGEEESYDEYMENAYEMLIKTLQ
jgi:AcrR family transcriptional regulator